MRSSRGQQTLVCAIPRASRRRPYKYVAPDVESWREELEASVTFANIQDNILSSVESLATATSRSWDLFNSRCGPPVIDVGIKAQRRFGLGSGGSRWISGTFPPHLGVESLLSQIVDAGDCLTYPDSHIGLASTVAALCRPIDGYRRHCFLLPANPPRPVSDGLALASPKGRPSLEYFSEMAGLSSLLSQLSARDARTYFTIYVHAPSAESLLSLRNVLRRLSTGRLGSPGMTVLVHSPHCTPQDPELAKFAQSPGMDLLLFGSFHETMGLAGAYLAGSRGLRAAVYESGVHVHDLAAALSDGYSPCRA